MWNSGMMLRQRSAGVSSSVVAMLWAEAKRFDCDSGTIVDSDGSKTELTLGQEEDISSVSDQIDEAFGKTFESSESGIEGYLAAVRVGASVITFQFGYAKDEDTSSLPSLDEIIKAGVEKAVKA